MRISPAICLHAGLAVVVATSVFAQAKRVSTYAADIVSPTEKPLVGVSAISEEIVAKLKSSEYENVVVMDFPGPDKTWSPFSSWLADQFSAALRNAGYPIAVIDRGRLAASLDEYGLSEEDEFGYGADKHRIAASLGADAIVEGSYGPAENGVGVTVNAYRVFELGDNITSLAASPIISVRGKIPFTKEVGSVVLLPLDALWPKQKSLATGEGGVSSPECVYCPNLNLSDGENKGHLEGVVLVMATITSDGSIARAKVIKSLDSDLDERAVERLGVWKLRPATNADGKPIPVRIPVEIVVRFKPA